MSDEALAEFAGALATFQAEIPHIGKDQHANAGQYGYAYAGLEDIAPKVLGLLASVGLSWTAKTDVTDAGFLLVSSLLHVGGWRESATYPLPDPSKANPQQIGSAITYGRRYTFTALTGVTPGGEDDDGAKALEARSAPQRAAQPQQQAPEPHTDHEWFTDWQERVRQVDSESRLVELWQEIAAKGRAGKLHPEDVDSVASPLFRERRKELRAAPKQEALT